MDTAERDSGGAVAAAGRLRVAVTPDQLRAVAAAIEHGAPIEVAAQVLELEGAAEAGLERGGTILLEVQTDARQERGLRSGAADDDTAIESLTAREREVLELVTEGMSNRAIGEQLSISEHTVKFHVGALLGKLAASTRAELVAIALRRGLILL